MSLPNTISIDSTIYQTKIFDEDGDLWLLIDGFACKVCSRTLARASPVFKAMLFGSFAEANSKTDDGKWVVKLQSDEMDPMMYILNIIHGWVDKIPKKFAPCDDTAAYDGDYYDAKSEVLYRVAQAADYYDVVRLLKPWAKTWLDEVRQDKAWSNEWGCEVLWAAWVLGDEKLLNQQLDLLVKSAQFEDSGELFVLDTYGGDWNLYEERRDLGGILGILDIADQLPNLRLHLIQALLAPVKSFLFRPLSLINPPCAGHMQLDISGGSEAVAVTFAQALLAADLFPLPEPEAVQKSPIDLMTDLWKVVQAFQQVSKTLFPLCNDCKPLKRVMETAHVAIGSRHLIRLDNEQREHLARRAKESGIAE